MTTYRDITARTDVEPVQGALGARAYDVTSPARSARPAWVVAYDDVWAEGVYPTAAQALAAVGDYPVRLPDPGDVPVEPTWTATLGDPGVSTWVSVTMTLIGVAVGLWLGVAA